MKAVKHYAKSILLPLAIAVAASLASTLFWHAQVTKETTFPEPAPASQYSEEKEGRMALLTLTSLEKRATRTLRAWIKKENQDRFVELLQNAQAGLGWYAVGNPGIDQRPNSRGRPVQIILPWQDMEKLEEITGDPAKWANSHTPGQTAADPQYDQMARVTVRMRNNNWGLLTLIVGNAIALVSGIVAAVGIGNGISDWQRQLRRRKAALKPETPPGNQPAAGNAEV